MLIVFELYINSSVIHVAGDKKSDTIPIQFAQYLPDIPFDGPIIKFINSILNNERRKVKRYYLMFPSSPWLSPAASSSAAHVPSPKYPSSPGAAWHPPGTHYPSSSESSGFSCWINRLLHRYFLFNNMARYRPDFKQILRKKPVMVISHYRFEKLLMIHLFLRNLFPITE